MSPDEMDRWVEEGVTGDEIDCQAAARPLLDVIQREYRRANRWELRALNAEAKADRLEAECAELTKLTATCTCQPYPHGDGPEPDCAVHGAVRAFNDATREIAALAGALGARTHESSSTSTPGQPRWCAAEDGDCLLAGGLAADHPVHRTPAVVRAELEGQPDA
jgi:hypothetical protein